MASYGISSLADSNLDLNLKDSFKAQKVTEYMRQFIFTDVSINAIKRLFQRELDDGLRKSDGSEPQEQSEMTMKITFFTEIFNGTESGDFVVIDLNSQHLILLLARVNPGFPVKTVSQYFWVNENIRRSPYIMIFEFLCDCILKFFTQYDLLQKTQTVGFCSDLPSVQFGIDQATLHYFTLSASEFPLNCYDIRRCFEIVLLKERYKDIKLNLVAILNKNTSMHMYACYAWGKIDIFVNLVNDCDILYFEEIGKVEKWKCERSTVKEVLIDTELRNFGGNGSLNFIATDLDWAIISTPLSFIRVDKRCRIEKFLSEKYLLELIRYILADLHHNLIYCRNADVGLLYKTEGISLSDIYNFEKSLKNLDQASLLLPGGSIGGSEEDAKIAHYVCKIVLIRAAVLTSICLASVLSRFQNEEFMIAVRSSLLWEHPDYETYIRNLMLELAPGKKFQFIPMEDVMSLQGSALATSIARRLDRSFLRF
ncbi:hexokinase-2-like [Stegodyphus dumicola]|uniref:hexokinase-2-like n=1 Tax=Stegodyphus dumicola TaxID=202533 RepID=UPI0015B15A34|nr:hexokinase-2-like [Stegodyphus dumicola]